MNHADIQLLAHSLAFEARRPLSSSTMGFRLRRVALRSGPVAPVGDGDSKTNAPGTYRPVGLTCPQHCPHLQARSCYAMGGNVGTHQRRAAREHGMEDEPYVRAAAIAMVWAAATGRVARLHVSGDLGGPDTPDTQYMLRLASVATSVRREFGRPVGSVVAWTYTDHRRESAPAQFRLMERSGIAVRFSEGDAVTHPHTDMPRLREARPDLRWARCPAQLRKVNCQDCRLCWTRPDIGIAFHPHGATASRAPDMV